MTDKRSESIDKSPCCGAEKALREINKARLLMIEAFRIPDRYLKFPRASGILRECHKPMPDKPVEGKEADNE